MENVYESLVFIDVEHKEFFEKNKADKEDVYKDSLVYLVGLSEDTRKHFDHILTAEGLNPMILDEPWVAGTSFRTLVLAFNLYNGFVYGLDCHYLEDKELEDLTKTELIKAIQDGKEGSIDNLFSYSLGYYYLQAINIRFKTVKYENNRRVLEKLAKSKQANENIENLLSELAKDE